MLVSRSTSRIAELDFGNALIQDDESPVLLAILASFRSRCAFRWAGCVVATLGVALAVWRTSSVSRDRQTERPPQSATSEPSKPDRRSLALAEVRGSIPGERRLQALVERARARPWSDDGYILLGRAWVRRARESSDPGYYLHAEACADVVLERSPANLAAKNLRGFVELNQHEFARAKATAEAIVASDPRDATAWGTLSDAALELGDFEAAVGAVGRMLEQKPGLPAYSRAAHLRWLKGDETGAVEAVRLAIDAGLDPSDPEPLAWVLVQAAELFFQRGDYAGADAGFGQALEVVADYPPALVGRGRVLLAGNDPRAASGLLRRAFDASPLVETGSLLSQALAGAGDRAGAEAAYAAAEREGLRGDRRSLSVMDSTLGRNPERALALARKERETRGDIYSDDALAWALYRNGEFELALESIERARRLGTRDARLLFHHGAILVGGGRGAAGRKLIEQALAQNPKFGPEAALEAARLLAGRT
jgi:tetratricopeptide (TPR) repeat protein